MSAAQSQTTLERLEALECHFTWDLDSSRTKFLQLKDKLEDIGTEEGTCWLGPIYNLQGFIQFMVGRPQEAQSFFMRAAEAFRQTPGAEEGPWMLVNHGNLAWLHHHLGDAAQSGVYLSKVDTLRREHPPPPEEELHAEVYAEKAWTLMKFSAEKKRLAADYFEEAIRMQPENVQWRSSQVIGIVNAAKHSEAGLPDADLEKMRIAVELDPENAYLAVHWLEQRAERGERIQDEARDLSQKIVRNPVSSYSGMKALLRLYRKSISVDEAIELAEEALENHPDVRYLKRCVALCYKWKLIFSRDGPPNQRKVDRAIELYQEVIDLYPDSSLVKKMDLAGIYAKSNHGKAEAERIYRTLLQRTDLEAPEKQVLYNNYAKYLNFDRGDREGSVRYHMKAAAITQPSFFRNNSIAALERIRDRGRNRMCREIRMFLENLPQ